MTKPANTVALTQLVSQIDFDSERYYNLYFESAEELPLADVSTEIWANLSSLVADLGKQRGELARLRRGIEELRMPAIETVGLDKVVEQLHSVETRLRSVADKKVAANEDESRVKRVLKDMLNVLDTLDRVFELITAQPDSVSEGVHTGLRSLYRLFQESLGRYVLEQMQIEPGSTFDPNEQMAMGTEPQAELNNGSVSRVLLKGYRLEGKPLRTAQVVVVKNV